MWWRNYSQTLFYIFKIGHVELWIDSLKFYTVCLFFFVCQLEVYRNILKLSCRPEPFTSFKAHFKNQKVAWKLVFLLHVLHNSWRQIFLLLYSFALPNFIVWLGLLCKTLSNISIAIVCWPISLGLLGSCILPGLGQNWPSCHNSSLADDLIIKLGQLVDQGLLIYKLLP